MGHTELLYYLQRNGGKLLFTLRARCVMYYITILAGRRYALPCTLSP